VTVAIEIQEGGASIPARARQRETARTRRIAEGAVAIVVIQHLMTVVRDEEIDVAVVVIVADADALSHPLPPTPAFEVTSVKVPSPLLRYRWLEGASSVEEADRRAPLIR
jgi:hypothetical protein